MTHKTVKCVIFTNLIKRLKLTKDNLLTITSVYLAFVVMLLAKCRPLEGMPVIFVR